MEENPYSKMRKELKAVGTVPWQVAAVVTGLVCGVPLAVGGVWGYFDAKGYGSRELALGMAVPGLLLLFWGVLGVLSRLRKARRDGEEMRPIWKKLGWGAALLPGTAGILATLSMVMGIPMMVLWLVAILPMGWGAVLIAWAMIPPKPVKPWYAPTISPTSPPTPRAR